jgi:hypothetical protein
MRGHSHSKNGVASLAYAPRIHLLRLMDCRVKPGNDGFLLAAGLARSFFAAALV